LRFERRPPAKLVFRSVYYFGMTGVVKTPRGRSEPLLPSKFRGVVTTPSYNTSDLRSFFDQCASSSWRAKLTFEVDDAERLQKIANRSIDLAICIGAFEHMVDKRAVLSSIYRVLKCSGRFFCLTPNADYVWYRPIAPLLGFATKHLSSDRRLTHDEFAALLGETGFGRTRSAPWKFIPRGDMPVVLASLLNVFDAMGRLARLDSLRGGLSVCAWKQATALRN